MKDISFPNISSYIFCNMYHSTLFSIVPFVIVYSKPGVCYAEIMVRLSVKAIIADN